MATSNATEKRPLWLSIEEQIQKLDAQALSSDMEASIQRMAGELDKVGHSVTGHGGNLIKLRIAVDKAREVGKPLLDDFNAAVSALTLEDAADPYKATNNILEKLGDTWPELKIAERRPDVINMDNVHRLNTRLVVEGANIPFTHDAEKYLHDK